MVAEVTGLARRGAMRSAAEEMSWMRGPSAALRGALLGLVAEHEGRGAYELANLLLARLGDTWRIDAKDVYRLLKQLETAGVVRSAEAPRRRQRGTHPVYFPTHATEGTLARWMETFFPMAPVRVGLQAKLAVARPEHVPGLLRSLKHYERECLEILQLAPQAGRGAPASWKALFVDCTREGVDGQLRQEIEWAQRTRARIREYAAVTER